jgi:hypothetical protein
MNEPITLILEVKATDFVDIANAKESIKQRCGELQDCEVNDTFPRSRNMFLYCAPALAEQIKTDEILCALTIFYDDTPVTIPPGS